MYSEKEMLFYAVDSGMIDVATIQMLIEMNEKKKYLEMHEHKIWQSEDGEWRTYLPDDTKRRLVRRRTREQLDKLICQHYK